MMIAAATVSLIVSVLLVVSILRRRQAALALARSEERCRTLMESVQEGVAVCQDGRFCFVNASLTRMLGFMREEFLSKPAEAFIHPDDRERVAEQHRVLLQTGKALPVFEFRMLHKGGQTAWIRNSVSVIDWNGAPAILGTCTDITAAKHAAEENRKLRAELEERVAARTGQLAAANVVLKREIDERTRAEADLKRSSEFLDSLIDALPNPVAANDEQHRFVQVNQTWCDFTGRTREELLNRTGPECFPEEQSRRFYEKNDLVFRTGLTVEAEERLTDAQGRERHVLTRKTLHAGRTGRRIVLAVLTDITDLKRLEAELRRSRDELEARIQERTAALTKAVTELRKEVTERIRTEEELQKSNELLNAILETTPLPAFVIDLDGRVQWLWNSAARRVLGWSKEEVLGKQLPTIAPEDQDEFHRNIQRVRSGQSIEGLECKRKRRDGTPIEYSLYAAAMRDSRGEIAGIASVLVDLTERRKAEAERRLFEARLMQSQKLESLGVLAGGIAHDFNNLLTGVLGYASLALNELPPHSGAHASVRQIEVSARRAAELTRQMLAYSGKGRFVIQPVQMGDVISEMAHLLEVSVSKRCKLACHFAANLPAVEADVTQVRQVIMNLIINASEAMGEKGGVITIGTGVMHCDRAYLSSSYLDENLPDGSYVWLEVTDTGCGIAPEVQNRIFEPFFTTKFTGRGLGLAAVLGIVRGHRGAVKIYSETGKGTTFKVLFPASSQSAAPVQPRRAQELNWRGSGLVLVVDDEPAVRHMAEMILTSLGFTVLTAADGREALGIFGRHAAGIRFVLLDLTMPVMDGEETFRELRRLQNGVRVILSSGYNEQQAISHFVGKGLAGFVQKPYSVRDLSETIQKVMESAETQPL